MDGLPLAVLDPGATGGGPALDLILDNGSPGVTSAGTWTATTSGSGYEGANYLEHTSGQLVVDNADTPFSTTGTWTSSTVGTGYGDEAIARGRRPRPPPLRSSSTIRIRAFPWSTPGRPMGRRRAIRSTSSRIRLRACPRVRSFMTTRMRPSVLPARGRPPRPIRIITAVIIFSTRNRPFRPLRLS